MLKKICAHGNLSFHENYFLNGNKYFTCLQIFDFPEESYMGFVNQLIGNKNVFVKVDVSSVNQMDYDVRINVQSKSRTVIWMKPRNIQRHGKQVRTRISFYSLIVI